MINNALIGFCIFILIIAYISFKLDDKHQALKFVFLSIIIFVLPTLSILGTNCENIVTNSTIVDNLTSYNYNYTCSDTNQNLMIKPILYIQRAYILYIFLYVLYILMTKYLDVDKIMGGFKKW